MAMPRIDLKNIGHWPIYLRFGMPILAFVMFVVIGYFLVISDLNEHMASALQQELILKAQIAQQKSRVINLNLYQQQLAQINGMLSAVGQELPYDTDVSQVLDNISNVGAQSGVSFNLIKPQAVVNREFYSELPVEISVMGTYQQIGEFVSHLSALPQIVSIGNFTLSPQMDFEPVKTRGTTPILLMNMQAIAYRYLPRQEVRNVGQ